MITVNNAIKFSNRKQPNDMELKGLSTDVKPTEIDGNRVAVNSIFLELDTKDFYYFTGETWEKVQIEDSSGEYDRDILEINRKLNTKVRYFDTVANMKSATDLRIGDMAVTKGHYEANDGGGAEYTIVEEQKGNSYQIETNNQLYAELVFKDEINILQIGAKRNNDIAPYILKYLQVASSRKHKLKIPYGTFLCSEITLNSWFNIVGESRFCGNTKIQPVTSGQNFIFKVFNENYIAHWNLEKITFETFSKYLNGGCLVLDTCMYGNCELSFQNVVGQAIIFKNCWEINFKNLIARHVLPITVGENKGVFQFEDSSKGAISTLFFDYIQLETIVGNIFVVDSNTVVHHNHINCINYESHNITKSSTDGLASIQYDVVQDETNIDKHFAIFKILDNSEIIDLSINSIDLNNLASAKYSYNNISYISDCLFFKDGQEQINKNVNCQISNVQFIGLKRNYQLLNERNGQNLISNSRNNLTINNINYAYTGNYYAYFNVRTTFAIVCNNNNIPREIENTPMSIANENRKVISAYNQVWGCTCYDANAINKNKLVYRPIVSDAYFKIRLRSRHLYICLRATDTTRIKIYNERTETQYNDIYAIDNTNGKYIIYSINLTEIDSSGFEVNDIIRISAGAPMYYDFYYFL